MYNKTMLIIIVYALTFLIGTFLSSAVSSSSSSASAVPSSSANNNSTKSTQSICDQSLWKHVYQPARLRLVDPCITITGTITKIGLDPDGDTHVLLAPDPQFLQCVNNVNVKQLNGNLMVEAVCFHHIKPSLIDANAACQNYQSNIVIPPLHSHVQITGSYVIDTETGGWAEIHPVTSISPILQ
jgi:hypothetical protein